MQEPIAVDAAADAAMGASEFGPIGRMLLTMHGETVCDIPVAPLSDAAPVYNRPYMPTPKRAVIAPEQVPAANLGQALSALLSCPDIASKRWVWEQYDHVIGGNTLQRPGGDAAVVRVHGTTKALAISTDCTPRYCYADPYEGGKQAVAETYRNISAVGATPLAITNCLNFANPQRPEIMAQIVEALRGMGDACRALDYPIVSGNVSLYNESKATGGGSAILPTPAIGGVGLMLDYAKSASIGFKTEGEAIFVIGQSNGHLGQSLWLRELHGLEDGAPPPVDLAKERAHAEFVRELVAEGKVRPEDKVTDYFPEFGGENKADITVEQVMASPYISSPLRRWMCATWGPGGTAGGRWCCATARSCASTRLMAVSLARRWSIRGVVISGPAAASSATGTRTSAPGTKLGASSWAAMVGAKARSCSILIALWFSVLASCCAST